MGKHEEDDDREGQEEHAGQSEIFLLEMLVVHRLQPHHQHELLQGGDEGGGNQVRVPGAGKIENRYGGDEHARNGQHNAHIGAEPAQAVDARRLLQLLRDSVEELPGHKDKHGLGQVGDDNGGKRVNQPHLGHHNILGQQHQLARDHHGEHEADKNYLFAREPEPGQAVARHGREDNVAQHHRQGGNGRILIPPHDGEIRKELLVVVQAPDGGRHKGADVPLWQKRIVHDVKHRNQKDQSQKGQEEIGEHLSDYASPRSHLFRPPS